MRLYTFLLLFFSLFGCNISNENLGNKYKIEIDTLSIRINANALDLYSKIAYNNEKKLLAGYNRFEHSIQFFELEKREYLRSIQLYKEGIEAVQAVNDILLTNDKIILLAYPEVVSLTYEGMVINKWKMSDLNDQISNKYIINGGIKINYLQHNELSVDKNFLYLYLYPPNLRMMERSFDSPLFCRFNFEREVVEIIQNIGYPAIFKSDIATGVLAIPTAIEINSNELVYSFPNHSTLYKYNFKKDSIIYNSPEPSVIPKVIEIKKDLGVKESLARSVTGSKYLPVKYDPKNELYYRVIRVENKITNKLDQYLLVISKKFDLIKELPLNNDKVYGQDFVITDKGVLFQLKDSYSEEIDFSYLLINTILK